MKRTVLLIIEAQDDYCGKGESRPSCPHYSGHSGMIRYHHNCMAYHHGLLTESYTDEDGAWSYRIRRCAECIEFDQGEATTAMIEKLEAAKAVQELRRRNKEDE